MRHRDLRGWTVALGIAVLLCACSPAPSPSPSPSPSPTASPKPSPSPSPSPSPTPAPSDSLTGLAIEPPYALVPMSPALESALRQQVGIAGSPLVDVAGREITQDGALRAYVMSIGYPPGVLTDAAFDAMLAAMGTAGNATFDRTMIGDVALSQAMIANSGVGAFRAGDTAYLVLAPGGVLVVPLVRAIVGANAALGEATPPGAAATVITIGISLPLSGPEAAETEAIKNGILLAVSDANVSHMIPGYTVRTQVLDHSVNNQHDPTQGAVDMATFISNPSVVAVVGPYNSIVAQAQIPISNHAGLLQCSPGTTDPSLTEGTEGATLRAANPSRINYVRVATTDDYEAIALADYAYRTAHRRTVAIVDDGTAYGQSAADQFATAFTRLGGTVVSRDGVTTAATDIAALLRRIKALKPDLVFFGGVTANGGGQIRRDMPKAGLGAVLFMGADGILDASGDVYGSFINVAGSAAANSISAFSAITQIPDPAPFIAEYNATFGTDPGVYSAPGYACAQVILQAAKAASVKGLLTRETIRAAAADPSTTAKTVIGDVSFDAVGDISEKTITLYKVVMDGAGGKGDWQFLKQTQFRVGG